MADPIDGPSLSSSDYTWGSKFGFVIWNRLPGDPLHCATTEQETLLFTGGVEYYFTFNSGFEQASYVRFEPLAYDGTSYVGAYINEDYAEELVGKIITPSQTGGDPSWSDPHPPISIEPGLFEYSEDFPVGAFQMVANNTNPRYWIAGIDSIDGFTDQGPGV
jgi:hypothetical protein